MCVFLFAIKYFHFSKSLNILLCLISTFLFLLLWLYYSFWVIFFFIFPINYYSFKYIIVCLLFISCLFDNAYLCFMFILFIFFRFIIFSYFPYVNLYYLKYLINSINILYLHYVFLFLCFFLTSQLLFYVSSCPLFFLFTYLLFFFPFFHSSLIKFEVYLIHFVWYFFIRFYPISLFPHLCLTTSLLYSFYNFLLFLCNLTLLFCLHYFNIFLL